MNGRWSVIVRAVMLSLFAMMLLSSGCNKDDDQPSANPTIDLRTDSGYTWLNDTLGLQDTVKVGVLIGRGSDAMHHFLVTVAYNGGTPSTTDSLRIGGDQFEFDKTIITRTTAGSERWGFAVVENDGDIIRRSLTFVVQ